MSRKVRVNLYIPPELVTTMKRLELDMSQHTTAMFLAVKRAAETGQPQTLTVRVDTRTAWTSQITESATPLQMWEKEPDPVSEEIWPDDRTKRL